MNTPRITPRPLLRIGAAILLGLAFAPTASAAPGDDWPSKPVKIIVPSAPGGSADFMARTFGRYFTQRTGQTVVVDDRAGAGAVIGALAAKAAPPDGYTFLVSGTSTHAANPILYSNLSYDPEKDFDEVGMFGLFPMVAIARKDGPLHSPADIISYAKAHPGKLSFGYHSASSQVPSELLKSRAGITANPIPYKNVTQIAIDIGAGLLDFAFMDAVSAAPSLQGGRLTAIAVTSPQRIPAMPDVPAVAEVLPGYAMEAWLGLAAPAGTPKPIIERMSGLLRDALADPAVKQALEGQGLTVRATTPKEQAAFVAADRLRWVDWVRIANIAPIQQ